MANRIRDVYVVNHRLDPHETELRIHVELDELTPTTEIKGRLMGPRCVYRSTVEIAYPMRLVSRVAESRHIELRVVIPEACWWEPKTPFLYQGPLELWQDGQICERTTIRHGIRDLRITSKGLILNGRNYVLRGKSIDPASTETDLQILHDQGINAVMTTFRSALEWTTDIGLWSFTDRYGLLVLCRARDAFDLSQFKSIFDVNASAFGCVVPCDICKDGLIEEDVLGYCERERPLLGVESPCSSVPDGVAFMLSAESEEPVSGNPILPKIVLTKKLLEPLPARPDFIGWIEADL